MKKILFTISTLFLISCSNENCSEEMVKLQNQRSQGWQNCNGSKACIEKIESDYNKAVDKLNCD